MESTEYIGYLAMSLTILSFMFEKIQWLRITNLSACITFVIYGMLINKIPVIATNIIIGLIQTIWLVKYYMTPKEKRVVK